MNVITIPKQILSKDNLVVIPQREYRELLLFKKYKEFTPTQEDRRALARAERNSKMRKTLSYDESARQLEFRN